MPWFPDFASAVELARRQTRAAGRVDPVGQYFAALNNGDPRTLETVWPGEVVVHDPRAGRVQGHRQLREFVRRNQAWLAERHTRIETVAATCVSGRAVVELLAHLTGDGRELAWPVAVVAESPDDRSVVFRTYCSQWPVDGRRHLRPPILRPGAVAPDGVVGRFHAALAAGDTEAIVSTFAPDGYSVGRPARTTPIAAPASCARSSPGASARAAASASQHCAITDDGVRCALEYNCVRWGRHGLPTQAGIGIYERTPDGLLTAVRVYDDIDAPVAVGQLQMNAASTNESTVSRRGVIAPHTADSR